MQLVLVAFCSATVFLRTRMGTSTLEGMKHAPTGQPKWRTLLFPTAPSFMWQHSLRHACAA